MRARAWSTANTLFTLETFALGTNGKHMLLTGSFKPSSGCFCPVGKGNQVSPHSCLTSHLRSGVCGMKSQSVSCPFSPFPNEYNLKYSVIKNATRKLRPKQYVCYVSAVYSILINSKEDTFLEVIVKFICDSFSLNLMS